MTTDSKTYERLARAIRFAAEHHRDQPNLERLAEEAHLSPHHFQRVFTQWAGISPKKFVSHMTLESAKTNLIRNRNILDTALEAGLSGPSRLHDLSITFEAMTPGQLRAKGRGLTIRYGVAASPFGFCIAFATERGLCGLAFAWEEDVELSIKRMIGRWPAASFVQDNAFAEKISSMIFDDSGQSIDLHAMGTNFQIKVWQALLTIPPGRTATYRSIAEKVCTAKASRAVGAANGANPISLLIPCHRVIRESGALSGYAWGIERKRALLAWESAMTGEAN